MELKIFNKMIIKNKKKMLLKKFKNYNNKERREGQNKMS